MTEQTDKATQKPGKSAPKKRRGKARSPDRKRAKAPGDKYDTAPGDEPANAPTPARAEPLADAKRSQDKTPQDQTCNPKTPDVKTPLGTTTAGDSAADGPAGKTASTSPAAARTLAPDPATIVFGSDRPIVAAPPKLPESSGLRFSGPSDGILKARGPQPTSAKASGLTFTSAKPGTNAKPGSAASATAAAPGKIPAKTNGTAKSGGKAAEGQGKDKPGSTTETSKASAAGAKAPETTSGKGTPGDGKKPETKGSAGAKPAGPTKPAIAPQASGRRLEKERTSHGFALTLFGLVVVVGGLTFWFSHIEAPQTPREDLAAAQPTPQAAPEMATAPSPAEATATPAEPPVEIPDYEPSLRAPEMPGPLAGKPPAAGSLDKTAASGNDLTVAEIGEIQGLLGELGLDPGPQNGVVSAQTTEAIRSYQDMAGLPGTGEANRVLLEELRAVVSLYGG